MCSTFFVHQQSTVLACNVDPAVRADAACMVVRLEVHLHHIKITYSITEHHLPCVQGVLGCVPPLPERHLSRQLQDASGQHGAGGCIQVREDAYAHLP